MHSIYRVLLFIVYFGILIDCQGGGGGGAGIFLLDFCYHLF
jgi:hypothetical protein